MDKRNLTLLMDFYELTMGNGYFLKGLKDRVAVFDAYFRTLPDQGGFAIMAGLDQVIDYMEKLHFTPEDIAYLRQRNLFDEAFLDYLANFEFACDVWAVPEGTPVFPGEPLVTVRGPVIQAQMLETMTLLLLNHQCLIATKANRIVRAAQGRAVMEFGSRRAQGADAANYGARAAYIAGAVGSANTWTDREMGIPALGTMAHSWVQLFSSEYEAFKAYAEVYPQDCTLLIDTYDVLQSGVPNAIKVFDEVVVPAGYRPKGVRIDSGDIAYLSKRTRQMLDEAGYQDCAIVASGGLDEYLIRDLLLQGAKLDSFGVGERLITAKSDPVFGGVYKMVAVADETGALEPRIKISENVDKITTPGFKCTWRLFDRDTGKAIADVISLADETIPEDEPFTLFDPKAIWKRKEVDNFRAERLQVPIYEKGQLVYARPSVEAIRTYCQEKLDTLWEEVTRFENPHKYYVDFTYKLWQLREDMLMRHRV
ncbi:nicotinate phosphoribosyltransferase [Peptococcus simiae]|uniref:Nicotinate phosphoribosyltransferase n=1 Tax=Peptococcus simiae TaxID=1643805 RepID=A0ABW9H085_9FIRM